MIGLLIALVLGLGDVDQGERAYREGHYSEALAQFQAALQEPSVPQGPALYDLGNCAYRLGRFAEAALHYRRAQLRLPRDREVRFNLRLAEQQLGIVASRGESFGSSVAAIVDSLTPGELLAAVATLESVGLLGLVLFRRRRGAQIAMALLVLIALAGAARLVQVAWFPSSPDGVVLAPEIGLRSEPRADLAVTLRLKAGEIVRVEERTDRWIRITHSRGRGWTERAGVGVVD